MTSASWRELLGTLGGISAALLLVFFLISLLAAVLSTGRRAVAGVLRADQLGRRDGPGWGVPDPVHPRPGRGDHVAGHRQRRRGDVLEGFPAR